MCVSKQSVLLYLVGASGVVSQCLCRTDCPAGASNIHCTIHGTNPDYASRKYRYLVCQLLTVFIIKTQQDFYLLFSEK